MKETVCTLTGILGSGLCLLFGLVMLGIGSFVFKKYQNEFIYHI